jgi:hypothetical protein
LTKAFIATGFVFGKSIKVTLAGISFFSGTKTAKKLEVGDQA